MHYYKKNIGDYHKKAGRLTMLQHGAYTLLMDSCYDREEFPTLEQAIEWVWASTTEEVEAVKFVLGRFFTLDNGVYIQDRIKDEIEKYHRNAKTNQRIAIEREEKRKKKRTNRANSVNETSTEEKQTVNEAPPNQEPLTINQEPLTINQERDLPAKAGNAPLEIFNYWKEVMKKGPNTTFSKKRMDKVKARLKDGYSVDFIKQAIYGCSITPHNNGTDPKGNGQKYDDLELICRYAEHLERFAENANRESANREPQVYSSATKQSIINLSDWELPENEE